MMLTAIGDEIWQHSMVIWVGPVALPHAMTVIRLSGGGLLIHSPTRLVPPLQAELSDLGPVDAIVAPSWWHDLFLRDWAQAYPTAKLYGAPALVERNRSLPFQPALDGSPSPWSEIGLLYVDRMRLLLDEIAMLHRTSRTLVVADLAFHITDQRPASMRLTFGLIGAYPGCGIPWLFRMAPRDRRYLRQKIEQLLTWDFDTLVVGHGDVVANNGKEALRQAYRWLL
jgi:hypothetical protein